VRRGFVVRTRADADTVEARANDMSRAKRAEKIDAHAAAHILQAAIDALSHLPRD